jgi:type I restriction enzyme S subunit
MNPLQFVENFDRVTDAPDSIPLLRRFILNLAVRGRLIAQDPRDEPGSELLKRMQAEKERLVSKGILKHQRHVTRAVEERAEFVVPRGWALTTLGEVAHKITDGTHKTPTYVSEGVPFVSVKDFSGGRLDFSNARRISKREHAMLYKRCDPQRGDILICRIGTLGKAVLVDTDKEFSLFVSVGLIRFSQKLMAPNFLRLFLNSPVAEDEYNRIKVGGGTHTNKLNLEDLHTIIFPLPPLAEQVRIVAKVNELMSLCNRLERVQAERERNRDRLAASTLHHLGNGSDNETFREHARFYLNQFPRLTKRAEQVPALRQTILNLAVRGQLVPQHSGDEPASEILKQIDAERERLIKAGETKEQKQVAMTGPSHAPFDVPQDWRWVSLGRIAYGFRYGTSVKCAYEATGEPVLRIPNVKNGRITTEDLKFGPLSRREAEDLRLQLGDILMVRSNGSLDLVGRPALVEGDTVGYCYAGYLVRVRTSVKYLDTRYLLLALSSTHTRSQIEVPIRTTVGLKNVNVTELSRLAIPLAPLAEQHRIVAKVDELMTLCDQLEEYLSTGQVERRVLLEALLNSALNDKTPNHKLLVSNA